MKLPQFHLRDLFWLLLVSALAAGWWRERQRPDGTFWKSLAEFCISALEREGDEIRYDEETGEKVCIIVVPHALAGDWAKRHPGQDVPFPTDYQKTKP
jgi:hypothetical protein